MPRILPAVLPTLATLTAAAVGVHGATRFLPPLPELTVTADPGPVEVPAQAASVTTIFEVRNTGTSTILNIGFTCAASGQVACVSVSPTAQASLTPGQLREVVVTYAAGSAGTGAVALTAAGNTGAPASDTLEVDVLANPVITLATPLVGAKNRAVVRTRRPLVSVRWTAGGPAPGEAVDSTTAQLTWRGVDVTQTARVNRGSWSGRRTRRKGSA